MAFTRRAAKVQSFGAIPGFSGRGHGEKLISDFGQRAYNHHGVFRQAIADDLRNAVNRLRVLYGSAAEFHHDHGSTAKDVDCSLIN
jgi:hypothetical protein